MARLLIALFITALVSTPVSGSWSRALDALQRSTVPLVCTEHQQPLCSAFSINEQEGYYLTANHCLTTEEGIPMIDGAKVTVVLQLPQMDIAVVQAPSRRPAMKPRIGILEEGTRAASYGWGYALSRPIFREFVVSVNLPDGFTGFDKPFVQGMSGGAIVDERGRVIGVAQEADRLTGWSVAMKLIFESTAVFWQ